MFNSILAEMVPSLVWVLLATEQNGKVNLSKETSPGPYKPEKSDISEHPRSLKQSSYPQISRT